MHQINLLFATVVFRPYVFIFLAMYLAAATLKVGARKALFFTLSAWAIAYVAEFSSIRNGIPFGLYHYIPSTVDCELWICGVPFMDSLSFTFLAYSSWAMARVFLCPAEGSGMGFALVESPHPCVPSPASRGELGEGTEPSPPAPLPQVGEGGKRYKGRFSIGTVFLGALLFMLIDVVIDPLSLRGDRWFLGKIYYYPDGGAYFGVTISNFIGWFIVGFVTLMVWGVIDKLPALTPCPSPTSRGVKEEDMEWEGNEEGGTEPSPSPEEGRHIGTAPTKGYMPYVDLLGPALYMIVLIFNLTMTFYIGESTIGWVGVFIFLPVVFLMGWKIKGDALIQQ